MHGPLLRRNPPGLLGLVATQATYVEGHAYLVLYNAIFVLPLVAMLALADSRLVFNTLGRWQLHHRSALKLGLGLGAVALGLLLLATLQVRRSAYAVPTA